MIQKFRFHLFKRRQRLHRSVAGMFSVKRSENAFATHIPVLIGLGRMMTVRRVIELGCGEYSTRTFLNRAVFPDLMQLESYETEAEWLNTMQERTSDDSRVRFTLAAEGMNRMIPQIDFAGADIVFIDDSLKRGQREATIQEVAKRYHLSNVLIIHDYEVRAYHEAAASLPHQFGFTGLNPNTGVAWDKAAISLQSLKKLNRLIRSEARHTPPDNIQRWVEFLSNAPL